MNKSRSVGRPRLSVRRLFSTDSARPRQIRPKPADAPKNGAQESRAEHPYDSKKEPRSDGSPFSTTPGLPPASPVSSLIAAEIDPRSPNANLKMLAALTAVESPPISRPTPRPFLGRRKDKSLGLLCKKLVSDVLSNPYLTKNGVLFMDDVGAYLNATRRRTYDVMNVLESVGIVSKICKSRYAWIGLDNLGDLLAQFKKEAEKKNYPRLVAVLTEMHEEAKEMKGNWPETRKEYFERTLKENFHPVHEKCNVPEANCFLDATPHLRRTFCCRKSDRPSLKAICRLFLMVLLSTPYPHKLSVDTATFILASLSSNSFMSFGQYRNHLSKGRCRRLYDVTNVLTSVGLIKKKRTPLSRQSPVLIFSGPLPSAPETPKISDIGDRDAASLSKEEVECEETMQEKTTTRVSDKILKAKNNNAPFLNILKAAEIERSRMLVDPGEEASDQSPRLPTAPGVNEIASSSSSVDGLSSSTRRLQIVTKNGSKFYLRIIKKVPLDFRPKTAVLSRNQFENASASQFPLESDSNSNEVLRVSTGNSSEIPIKVLRLS